MIRRFGELLLWAWAVIVVQWMFVALQLGPIAMSANGFVLQARLEGGSWLTALGIATVLVCFFATGFGGKHETARAWCFDLLHVAANVASAIWILCLILLILMWWIVLPGLAVHAWCFWSMKRLRRQVEDSEDALAGRRAGRLAVLWIFSVMGPPWFLFIGSS